MEKRMLFSWSASRLWFLVQTFVYCHGCITFTPSDLILDAPVYHGVYSMTASNDLYILGGTTLDMSGNELPLSQYYIWNGHKPTILNHLNIATSAAISAIYGIAYDHFACLSGSTCAVAMSNDIIYIMGVNYFDTAAYNLQYNPNKVLTFDVVINEFVPNAIHLPFATTQGCVAADKANIFYVGGYDEDGHTTGYVQQISLEHNHQATLLTLLPSDTTVAGAHCVYHREHLWIFGGFADDGTQYDTIWSYHIPTATWAYSLQPLSHATITATIVAPDDLIYIIGGDQIDVFDANTARIISRHIQLSLDRFAVAAVGVSDVSMTASQHDRDDANRWQFWIFGGLALRRNSTAFIALDSVEVAEFTDDNVLTSTFYPIPTTNVFDDVLPENNDQVAAAGGDRWTMYPQPSWIWFVIMASLAAMAVVICAMLSCMLYCRGREQQDQEQRARRRSAFKQYRNSSDAQSGGRSYHHMHANIKTTSLDLDDNENLEMISLALKYNEQMQTGHTASIHEKKYSEGVAITHFE